MQLLHVFSRQPVILQTLLCCTLPFPCGSLHKALLFNGTVLTREVNGTLAHALVTTKEGILPNTPARVTSLEIRITSGVAERCGARVMRTDTREDLFQLLKAAMSILLDLLSASPGVIGCCIRSWWCI